MNYILVSLTDFATLLIYITCLLFFCGCVTVWISTESLVPIKEVWQVTVIQFYVLNEGIHNLPTKCYPCQLRKGYVQKVRNL